jgi:predicted outer membrane repeat protein
MLFGTGARPVINFSDAISAGIYINRVDAIVRNNLLTENGTGTGNPSADKSGIGIAVEAASPTLYNNTITNNYNIFGGAGIGVIDGNPTIYNNTISGNMSYGYGAGIGIVDGMYLMESMAPSAIRESRSEEPAILRPVIYNNTITNNAAVTGPGIFFYYRADPKNADGTSWKHFNSGTANVTFVENTTNSNNTYTGNTNLGDYTDGADIRYGTDTTAEGTLTLRPEAGTEREAIILNIDYLIGQEFHGGNLTVDIPTGFELTADASVIIDGTATEASNYTYSTQGITITGINLEAGTVTLRLANQAIPTGLANVSESRDLGYTFKARGDADGADTAWDESDESETEFTSENLSTNTDFRLTGTNPESIQYKATSPATELKVASETTVQTVLDNIEAADDSEQSYSIYNDTTSKESPLATDTELTGAATLVVVSEHGEPYSAEFAIAINVTKFVRLEQENVASGGRLISRTGAALNTTWHDTIAQAVDSVIGFSQSTITVWEGYYRENVDFGDKVIHLTSTDPASQTVRENTIIDGDGQGNTIMIGVVGGSVSSVRFPAGEIIVEGFTITGGEQEAVAVSTRGGATTLIEQIHAGVAVFGVNATIRNNLITENGDQITGSTGIGIVTENASPSIYNNTISNNYGGDNWQAKGAGITVTSGSPEIYNNMISGNICNNGAGIIVANKRMLDFALSEEHPTIPEIYKNTFTNNTAIYEGAGIYITSDATVLNRNGEAWYRFYSPYVPIAFIERAAVEDRNTYTANQLTPPPIASREGNAEKTDIAFMPMGEGSENSPSGTLETAPATATGKVEEPFIFTATYTFDGPCYDASVTFSGMEALDLSTQQASVTIGGASPRPLSADEFDAVAGTVSLGGITGESTVVILSIRQTSAIDPQILTFEVSSDYDGSGTYYAWQVSGDEASSTLEIPLMLFTLEIDGTFQDYAIFSDAFNAVQNGETAIIHVAESTTVTVTTQFSVEGGKDITIKPTDGASVTFDGDENETRLFYVSGATLKLYDTVLKNGNPLSGFLGGAVYLYNGGRLILEDSVVASNTSTQHGGGICVYFNSSATITNTSFLYNAGGYGGGLCVRNNSSATVSHTTFASNTNSSGGGIHLDGGVLQLSDSTITYNTSAIFGGGIYLGASSVAAISDTIVASNTATMNGGGIYFQDGTISLDDCVIENNHSDQNGGGIYMTPSSGLPTLNFNSGHIRLNTADGDGGGIYRNAGNVYTGEGQWIFALNPYNANFSVNSSGQMTDYAVSPAKVYNNDAVGQGDQMIW